jgi:RsiW-degrading membrane proteinase PrsW (M82 family)
MMIMRSIGSVIVGYLVFAVAAVALFAITGRDAHAEAPVWFMVGSTLYGMLFAAVGGYIAALLAGRSPVAHAFAITVIIALGTLASIFTRPAGGTIWSQLAALFLMAPSATVGGWVASRCKR